MKKYFVIGNKVSTSLSPVIFNYWFKKYKINASYGFIEINEDNFDKEVKKILSKTKTSGLNITIPFKKKIMKHIDSLDKHSRKIDAVNCVSIKNKTKGINTDWYGYYKSLKIKTSLKHQNIILIGYGGAAHAIHYVLQKKGYKNIKMPVGFLGLQ